MEKVGDGVWREWGKMAKNKMNKNIVSSWKNDIQPVKALEPGR